MNAWGCSVKCMSDWQFVAVYISPRKSRISSSFFSACSSVFACERCLASAWSQRKCLRRSSRFFDLWTAKDSFKMPCFRWRLYLAVRPWAMQLSAVETRFQKVMAFSWFVIRPRLQDPMCSLRSLKMAQSPCVVSRCRVEWQIWILGAAPCAHCPKLRSVAWILMSWSKSPRLVLTRFDAFAGWDRMRRSPPRWRIWVISWVWSRHFAVLSWHLWGAQIEVNPRSCGQRSYYLWPNAEEEDDKPVFFEFESFWGMWIQFGHIDSIPGHCRGWDRLSEGPFGLDKRCHRVFSPGWGAAFTIIYI